MKKLVVIINGIGSVGKDTICQIVAQYYPVKIISAIDPIKKIALHGGWSYCDKSLKGRRLLSELKLAFIKYNDLPVSHLLEEYSTFLQSSSDILFAHIREPEEIAKFKSAVSTPCVTLLITSLSSSNAYFGNYSDDEVGNYRYDYIYNNVLSLEELDSDFMIFFESILRKQK